MKRTVIRDKRFARARPADEAQIEVEREAVAGWMYPSCVRVEARAGSAERMKSQMRSTNSPATRPHAAMTADARPDDALGASSR